MAKVRVTQAVLEAVVVNPSRSPTTPDTGRVAVTQAVLEAVVRATGAVRVTQAVLEVVVRAGDTDTGGGGGGTSGGVKTFGYAG